MRDYFNYDVIYAMNITDIDDKIIKRARQNHLMKEYLAKDLPIASLLNDAKEALKPLGDKLKTEEDEDKKTMYAKLEKNVKAAIEQAEKSLADNQGQDEAKTVLLEHARDVYMEWLDRQFGKSITDNAIFAALPKHYEQEYLEDMAALNVEPPECLTRVSEYVPEVVEFVQKIIDNGYAYEAQSSVYFDTAKFSQADNHYYAKLVPEAFGDQKLLQDGEGDLSISDERLREKKGQSDFALWKASKPGEPSWDSPWGKGRPGWHIECSIMASTILGESFDIHTGGVDLKFPHHDNELAQSEAAYGHSHWVHYFLHSGHLHIDGCKMSKSLKNFITIRQALQRNTSRQLRLAFLLHSWKDTLDYSNDTMAETLNFEKLLNEFFRSVKDIIRKSSPSHPNGFTKWHAEEMELNEKFMTCQACVHEALCDSIFGAIDGEDPIGFPAAGSSASANMEEAVMPYLDAFAKFRDDVRQVARQEKSGGILKLCDEVRDDVLPNLGVRLEDHEGQETVIKLVDRETLLRERQEKIEVQAHWIYCMQSNLKICTAGREEEIGEREEKGRISRCSEAQKRIPPTELFKSETDKYSKFDDKGMPTHDANGEELTKGQLKKLTKLYDAQQKKYQDFLKSQQRAASLE
ncbi:hypothetical protein CAPTEDRAFT_218029 [Capitella teleta]|uniref:cysteine--tRNA ligase n=1 Tax=Capitella teleta TaxID=283909 RepID=R7TMX3_CAPTE|nr:hypothetical protein CAPTEDRAFT_218029 [Capitella teleta]|eukprot:ELT92901.1 hypothetical protein CAPTEDRAFT_218029 [Capitella teleta]